MGTGHTNEVAEKLLPLQGEESVTEYILFSTVTL